MIYNILKVRNGILGMKCKRFSLFFFSCCLVYIPTCITAHLNLIRTHTHTHTNQDEYNVIKNTVTYVDAIRRDTSSINFSSISAYKLKIKSSIIFHIAYNDDCIRKATSIKNRYWNRSIYLDLRIYSPFD